MAVSELDRIIGARARHLRLKRRLSIGEVAAALGASAENLAAMEEGRARIGAETMLWLCEAYRVGAHCFYAGAIDHDGKRADARLFLRLLINSRSQN